MMAKEPVEVKRAAGGDMPAQGGMSQMMAMLKAMPAGMKSDSGHYWCAMCKKMFALDEPVCPYMPTMCINTPIPVEFLAPGSTAFYERAGLFYPKFIQPLLAEAVARAADPAKLGEAFADNYLSDLAEWKVHYEDSPLETVKSFLIYTSGFDVATRTSGSSITLLMMDAGRLWGEEMPAKKRSKAALLAGAQRVAAEIGFDVPLDLHFVSMISGPMGRYYCAQCGMFFEFGDPRPSVTCPFMPQKCKFKPVPIDQAPGRPFALDIVVKIHKVSPSLFIKQLESALKSSPEEGKNPFTKTEAREMLTRILEGWNFDITVSEKLRSLYEQIGISE